MQLVTTEGRRDRGVSDPTQIEISKFAIQSHGDTHVCFIVIIWISPRQLTLVCIGALLDAPLNNFTSFYPKWNNLKSFYVEGIQEIKVNGIY